LTNAHFLL